MNNTKETNQFIITKIFRVVNFFGAILFALTVLIDGLQLIAAYYSVYFLIVFIAFLYLETRYYNLTQANLKDYLIKHPISAIGGLLPILVILISRFSS